MMNLFGLFKHIHLLSIACSLSLFFLRAILSFTQPTWLTHRWLKIFPHMIDTVLLLSGIGLICLTHYYPFTEDGAWLTEKLVGVVLYILLGFIALNITKYSAKVRLAALLLICIDLSGVFYLAHNKMPLMVMS